MGEGWGEGLLSPTPLLPLSCSLAYNGTATPPPSRRCFALSSFALPSREGKIGPSLRGSFEPKQSSLFRKDMSVGRLENTLFNVKSLPSYLLIFLPSNFCVTSSRNKFGIILKFKTLVTSLLCWGGGSSKLLYTTFFILLNSYFCFHYLRFFTICQYLIIGVLF